LKVYHDVQKVRVAVGNRVAVEEFVHCADCGVTVPKPRGWAGKCPVCGSTNASLARREPDPVLVAVRDGLRSIERSLYSKIAAAVKGEPLWSLWLSRVRGAGPVAAAFLASLPVWRFDTVSGLWKYCGLHVEWVCASCGRVVNVPPPGPCPYCGGPVVGRAPRRRRGERAGWNPWARRMAFTTAASLARAGGYYAGWHRRFLEESARKHPDWTPGHVRMDALRRTAKLFLSHAWEVSRLLRGLPLREPYPSAVHADSYIPPGVDEDEDGEFRSKVIVPLLQRRGLPPEDYDRYVRQALSYLRK